jgi:hypothetical protein
MKGDLPYRVAGIGLIAASALTTLLHEHYLSAHAGDAPTLLEFGLALTTFVLASVGMMLVATGARLFRAPAPEQDTLAARLAERAMAEDRTR